MNASDLAFVEEGEMGYGDIDEAALRLCAMAREQNVIIVSLRDKLVDETARRLA